MWSTVVNLPGHLVHDGETPLLWPEHIQDGTGPAELCVWIYKASGEVKSETNEHPGLTWELPAGVNRSDAIREAIAKAVDDAPPISNLQV